MTKRAVIYARVSKDRDESVSLEAQVEHCTARAKQLGATVVKVFVDEGISGRAAGNRRAFQHAKAFCEVSNIQFFITWSTSRFARNLLDLFHVSQTLKDCGTRLECLNADVDDETDAGFVNKAINGLMDEMYSRQVARDTLRSQKQMAAAGLFTGGGIPFGYRTVKDGAHSRLQPDPDEHQVVKRIFELALAGHGAQAIAAKLNELGALRRGHTWTKNGVAYLLKNEVYTGVRTFNKTHRRSGKAKPADEWIRVESHQALVSRQEFERVQKMLEERAPVQEHGSTARALFAFVGLAHCGNCSGRLQIRTGKGRGGTLYSYYGCVAHLHGQPRCTFRPLRADRFDEWLLEQIVGYLITPETMAEALDELLAAGASWASERAARRAQLAEKVRDIEQRRARLLDVLETSGKATADLPGVLAQIRARGEELDQLQAELDRLESAQPKGTPARVDPEVAVELMRELLLGADLRQRRAFLGAFVDRVTVSAAGVDVDYRPEALLNTGLPTGVRSGRLWLPVSCPLRTKRVTFERPAWPRRVISARSGHPASPGA